MACAHIIFRQLVVQEGCHPYPGTNRVKGFNLESNGFAHEDLAEDLHAIKDNLKMNWRRKSRLYLF